MSQLLEQKPFGPREESRLVGELVQLTQRHLAGCVPYARVFSQFKVAERIEDIPFLHVQAFKHVAFRTEGAGIQAGRTLKSSSTSGSQPSQVFLDAESSALQSKSSIAIFRDFLGSELRPLLILDDSRALIRKGDMSARIAAALSLKPLASSLHFLLGDANRADTLKLEQLEKALALSESHLVYGFTWILWQAFTQTLPGNLVSALKTKKIAFVHSGGWKRLEAQRVSREKFESSLLSLAGPGSQVLDFYGLVEQVGMVFPLCSEGYRHPPVWGDVLIRDSRTLETLEGKQGQIQLLNTLALGAPYHSVLTEDVGQIEPGPCACGRSGKRFSLHGRLANAEVRGCANV